MHEKLSTDAIKELVLNDNGTFHGEKVPGLTYINFFYGNNGTGKTTISRAVDELKYPGFYTLVYNQDFIDKNLRKETSTMDAIYMFDEAAIRSKEEFDRKTTELEQKKKEKKELEDKKKKYIEEIVNLGERYVDDCIAATKDFRGNYKDALSGGYIKKGQKLVDKFMKMGSGTKQDMEEADRLYAVAYDSSATTYGLLTTEFDTSILEKIASDGMLQEVITSSDTSEFAKNVKKMQNMAWVRQGHDTIHENGNLCPYCQQALPPDFEEKIKALFDETYQESVNYLKELRTKYVNASNILYKELSNAEQTDFPQADFSGYDDKKKLLMESIQRNLNVLQGKIDAPVKQVTLEKIDISPLTEILKTNNEKIKSHNEIVKNAKKNQEKIGDMLWSQMAFMTEDIRSTYHDNVQKAKQESAKCDQPIADKKTEVEDIEKEIKTLSKSTVSTTEAVKDMQKRLTDSGFESFSIVPMGDNQYQIQRPDGTPADHLSEGEEDFLAFLYFYELVKGKGSAKEDDANTQDKIVVVDDPISSMDSNSLFIVSGMVRELIGICRNGIDYLHLEGNEKYIEQIFILTHNPYFHQSVSHGLEQYFEYVNFYLVKKRHNESSVELCTMPDSNALSQMVNRNPVQSSYSALWQEYRKEDRPLILMNIMRRILEYYFIQICGYEGKELEDDILAGFSDPEDLRIARTMLLYLTSSPADGFNFADDSLDVDACRKTFEKLFEIMGQKTHFDMMMKS